MMFTRCSHWAGEGISDWLSGPGRKDVEASGYTLMPGQQGKDVQSFRIFFVLAKDGAGKTWLINYMAYARPDHSVRYGRIVEEPNTAATKNNSDVAVQHFIRMSKQEMGGAGGGAIRVETPTTAPGQGLKPAEIRGVVLHTEYGVGDARAVQSLPVALMTIPGRFGCLGPGRIRRITRRRRDISGNSEAAMENAANRIHKSNGKI